MNLEGQLAFILAEEFTKNSNQIELEKAAELGLPDLVQ